MKRIKSTVVQQDKVTGIWYAGVEIENTDPANYDGYCDGCTFSGYYYDCGRSNHFNCGKLIWKEIGTK